MLLYAPGLTGLFTATGALEVPGAKLYGGPLGSALAPLYSKLPPLIRGYIAAVSDEHERLSAARRVARGEASPEIVPDPMVPAMPSAATLRDVAWLAEIGGQLVRRDGSSARVAVRIDPHNRAVKGCR